MADSPDETTRLVDLVALAAQSADRGPIWSHQGDELNVNLLLLPEGSGIAEHVNSEVEVLIVGVAGEGAVEIDGTPHRLASGQALVVPKGARRAIRSVGGRFAYLTCHRRRAGLWPQGVPRPTQAGC
jgi:quercetin dioxygenase-like cupin family protein